VTWGRGSTKANHWGHLLDGGDGSFNRRGDDKPTNTSDYDQRNKVHYTYTKEKLPPQFNYYQLPS